MDKRENTLPVAACSLSNNSERAELQMLLALVTERESAESLAGPAPLRDLQCAMIIALIHMADVNTTHSTSMYVFVCNSFIPCFYTYQMTC